MYGQETSCVPLPEADLKEQLAEAITHLNAPDRAALLQFVPEQDTPTVEEVPAELRNFSYTQVGGKLFYNENDNLTPVEVPATTAERIRGMIGLRDITRDLIEAQLNGGSEDTITDLQQKLNTAYDSFQAKYGLINSTGNKRAFEQDSSYCLLCSLEVLDEDGKLERNCDPGVSNRFGELPFFLTHQSDSLYWFQIGIIVSVIRNNEVIPSLKSER